MSRRSAFTLVEMIIVCVVIGILLMIAVPQWMMVRRVSREKGCFENQRQIESAKYRWAFSEGKKNGDVPAEGNLVPEFLAKFPVCPSGGTYTIGAVGAEVTCSDHPKP